MEGQWGSPIRKAPPPPSLSSLFTPFHFTFQIPELLTSIPRPSLFNYCATPFSIGEFTIYLHFWSSANKLRFWCSIPSSRPRLIPRHWTARPRLQQTGLTTLCLRPYNSSIVTSHHSDLPYTTPFEGQAEPMNESTPSPSPAPVPKASSHPKPSPSPSAGTKRKRTTGAKYYAVKNGFKPGLYYSWNDCLAQITGFKGAICESPRGLLTGFWRNLWT